MGAGKTTIAHMLAEYFGYSYVDMDTNIVKTSGRESDTDIFAKDGEIHFRELEMAEAKLLGNATDAIISTGGGIIMNKLNMDYLKEGSVTVYLKNTFETAHKRISKNRIPPLFQDIEKAKALYTLRKPLYEHYADITVETDEKDPKTIAEEIVARIENSALVNRHCEE